MRGGQNRKSRRQKRLSGTLRRDRDGVKKRGRPRVAARPRRARGNVVPFPTKDVQGFRPPTWISIDAADKWYELAPKLLDRGLLTPMTEDLLAMACSEFASMVKLQRQVNRDGEIIKGYRGYPVKHPASLPLERRTKRYMECLTRMGMTPVDARRVDMDEPADADDAFFG